MMPKTYLQQGSSIKAPVPETMPGEVEQLQSNSHLKVLTYKDVQREAQRAASVPPPTVYSGKSESQKEVEALITEMRTKRMAMDRDKPETIAQKQVYSNALQTLKDMLNGGQKLSVAEAYYTIESAFGTPYLSKQQFLDKIKESADFIKKWMPQNGLNPKEAEAKHYAIQKFMSEKLSITVSKTGDKENKMATIEHHPFRYDYDDFVAEKDFRNFFVTKLAATGAGQCNSMPAMYLCLAEALGVEAYLSFAPQHSFIKYKDAGGNLHGYETTSNWYLTDRWYQDNLFISAEAKRSGIFLDTVNKRQVVANGMIDLAHGYMVKFGGWEENFIADCVNSVREYFPNGNNIYSYFVYSHLLRRKIDIMMLENDFTQPSQLYTMPSGAQLIDALRANEKKIAELGYREMPENAYKQLMEELEFKNNEQAEKGIDGKTKRELFLKYEK